MFWLLLFVGWELGVVLKTSSITHVFEKIILVKQSQPCHWRNLKSVTKRDVSNQTIVLEGNRTEASSSSDEQQSDKENAQSDNISLFQSLRVLQEGEEEADDPDAADLKSKYRFLVGFSAPPPLTPPFKPLNVVCSRRDQGAKRDMHEDQRPLDDIGEWFAAAWNSARLADAHLLEAAESEKGRRHL